MCEYNILFHYFRAQKLMQKIIKIDLYRNLPRAIYISMPLVTIIYVLANVAYLAVLTPNDMVTTKAIAVVSEVLNLFSNQQIHINTNNIHLCFFFFQTFGHLAMGPLFEWVMPLMVALSAFGGLCVHIMTSSRY